MSDAQLIGLDVGTTSCKAGLFDTRGHLLALTSTGYPLERPQLGHVEQDPEQYWAATVRCLRDLLLSPAADLARLAAIGACGQSPTLVLLDADHRPLRPAILWQDTRAGAEAVRLAADPGSDALAEWLGIRWPVDASLPLARFLWLREHEPDVVDRTAAVLQPKDFVNFRLTGQIASDNWSAKGLAHVITRQPVPALAERSGLALGAVPRTFTAHEIMGQVSTAGAAATGLPPGLPVAAGWTDALSAMLGTGALGRPGLACDVSGTSEVVGVVQPERPATTGRLMAAPVLDSGRWMLYGPTQASGGSLGWAVNAIKSAGAADGEDDGELVEIDLALAAATRAPAGAGGLIFLPYLEGERAPIWDPRARGAFIGLTSSHGPADLFRAVLEGVACSVRHILSGAEEATGQRPMEVRVAGGGARLTLWNQIKADVTGCSVQPCAVSENGVLGAAMLGALGAGLFAGVEEVSAAMVALQEPCLPNQEYRGIYDRAFDRYASLYPRLKDLF